jgi:hypothetical protein
VIKDHKGGKPVTAIALQLGLSHFTVARISNNKKLFKNKVMEAEREDLLLG